MKKVLLIVDPQVDFILGSLAVEGAPAAMNRLTEAIRDRTLDYDCVAITCDWHPEDHCSFEKNGGTWPVHCVKNCPGAGVYIDLWNALWERKPLPDVYYKGTEADREEYSIFENKNSGVDLEILLDSQFEFGPGSEIRVVGIAGDYCVYNTICSLIELGFGQAVVVDTRFIASIDGGDKLNALIKNYNLKCC